MPPKKRGSKQPQITPKKAKAVNGSLASAASRNEDEVGEPGKGSDPCPVCGRTFHANSDMNRHVTEVHEGMKPFRCERCGESFGRKSSLNSHRRKKYRCKLDQGSDSPADGPVAMQQGSILMEAQNVMGQELRNNRRDRGTGAELCDPGSASETMLPGDLCSRSMIWSLHRKILEMKSEHTQLKEQLERVETENKQLRKGASGWPGETSQPRVQKQGPPSPPPTGDLTGSTQVGNDDGVGADGSAQHQIQASPGDSSDRFWSETDDPLGLSVAPTNDVAQQTPDQPGEAEGGTWPEGFSGDLEYYLSFAGTQDESNTPHARSQSADGTCAGDASLPSGQELRLGAAIVAEQGGRVRKSKTTIANFEQVMDSTATRG